MKFRIIKYYERYKPQVFSDKSNEYINIGNPPGYATAEEAEYYCWRYKAENDDIIVKEFEL